MFFESRDRDNLPLTRLGNVPIYATTIIVAALVVGLVVSALLGRFAASAMFAFGPELFWRHGHVWRAVSYLIVDEPDFFTLFSLLFIFSFGRDCEQELGRRRYFGFLAVLVATPVLISTVLWLVGLGGWVEGSRYLSIGLVIAFATIYPNVEWWNVLPMKYVAAACVFIAAIGDLSRGNQIGLACTLVTCAASFAYIRAMRAGAWEGFSMPAFFRRKPKFRVLPSPDVRESASASDMDVLLDKIAKSGMASLTTKERARLEAGRAELLKKDRR
jgi:membrane associated rhomboid family serine protease